MATFKRGQERILTGLIEHAAESRSTLEKMTAHFEEWLDHQGQLEGRLDAHEERLAALEKGKP